MSILTILQGAWAIQPDTLAMIWDIYEARLSRGGRLSAEQIAEIEAATGKTLEGTRLSSQVQDGVAIIPVMGPMIPRANMLQEMSGATSYGMIRNDVANALNDSSIRSILLNFDTPGGSVNQLYDLATFLRTANTVKPVAAWTDGSMTSAGQLLGAATGETWIGSDSAQLGSIGVITMHRDISAAEEKRGEKTTLIYSGRDKAVGHPFGPLSEDHRGVIQGRLDYLYSTFVDSIASYRAMDRNQVANEVADARIFTGRQAIDAGLADGMTSLDDMVAMMRDKGMKRTYSAATALSAESHTEVTSMDRATLQNEHAALFAEVLAEGRAAGAAEAVAEERARIAGVLAVPAVGHGSLVSAALTDGSTAEQLSLRILQAEQTQRDKHLEASAAGANNPVQASEAPADGTEEARALIGAAVAAGSVA